MNSDLLQRAAELTRSGESFVVAVVVRREPASSAQVGNTALITESGEYHGWLGGSCIHSDRRARSSCGAARWRRRG